MPRPTALRAARLAPPLALVLALACAGETLHTPPPPDQRELYWDLQLNHHAVTLSTTAPYDRLTVVATPRNIGQEPLPGLPAPQYVSSDAEHVVVTPAGELVAVAPTAPDAHVMVTATLTAGNLKHSDYVFVRVVDNPAPPVLTTFSVHPVPPDSAKVASIIDGDAIVLDTLPVRATDATGAPMTDLLVSFRVSGAGPAMTGSRLSFNEFVGVDEVTGVVSGLLPGKTTIYAAATVFGVAKADTLPYRIGLPITGRFVVAKRTDGRPGSTMPERVLTLAAGAEVRWVALAADTAMDLDISFTDPTHVAGFLGSPVSLHDPLTASLCEIFAFVYGPAGVDCANRGDFVLPATQNPFTGMAGFGIAARTFPVPGTYDFRSTGHGLQGRIVVIDESE